jgi:hypothetical protein
LAAREAGISVAASAGNAGPSYFSADHTSPWVTTVGASTHDRILDAGNKTIDNFEGTPTRRLPRAAISGKSFSGSITGEVVLAENYPDPNPNDSYSPASCNVPFPAGTFTADQIVLCERGDIARVTKAENVAAGGAGGFILQNISSAADNLVADAYVIPGIQVKRAHRYTLRNWVKYSDAGTTRATISDFTNTYELDEENGNYLARFSSMGPSRYHDTLVPDLTAPGVDIYAANADDQPFTNSPSTSDWTMMSGTSMAAPHVAGSMALLMQMHPQWTPAEVQSALMMTAGDVWLDFYGNRLAPFYNFMAGAGSMNLARAAQTGLVMDESIENYRDANPRNGGLVNWLNIPSMVDMDCQLTCSWMRTVKATKDGSWNVSAIAQEEGVTIKVSPEQFSLKAGESQSIFIEASLPNITEQLIEPVEEGASWEYIANDGRLFNGKLILSEANQNAPELHMPMVMRNNVKELPYSHNVDISRDQGSDKFRVNTDDYSQLTPRYYGLVKPSTYESSLETSIPMISLSQIEKGWDFHSITVPEGTKRLVVEVQQVTPLSTTENLSPRYTKSNYPHVAIGVDKNANGSFVISDEESAETGETIFTEYLSETICYSSSESETNYCNIVNPEPGEYWVATATLAGTRGELFDVVTSYALVSDSDDTGNISISGPESHDGNGDYNLTLNWDIPESQPGDVFYGGFDLGNMPGAEGTLGFTSVRIERTEDAVSWSVSQDKARSMDVLDVKVKLRPNLETDDRDYDIQIDLPDSMRLATDSIRSSNEEIASAIVADSKSLTISGSQLATRFVEREYKVTTNLNDEMCHTPLIDEYSEGGYIDLQGEFGIQPNANWLVGDSKTVYDVPIDWLFWNQDATFKLYNQENAGYMRMTTVGVMQFNTAWWMLRYHRGPGFLYESLAPFWRGSFTMDYLNHWSDPRGLTIASQYASERPDLGDLLFLEFDNVKDSYTGDEFDFQTILRSGLDFHEGKHEIIFAYDNLGAGLSSGAVFVEGFDSAFSSNAGPKDGLLYEMLGFDNLDEVLSDNLVICFDYEGPERSGVELTFKVAVKPEATGTTQDITMTYTLEGQEQKALVHNVTVNGNIKIADIEDLSVEENGRIDNIGVMHLDANEVPNTLEVTGDNISAEVDGMNFNLIPDADFHGETLVTVTVRDNEYATDKASTTFLLTVISDGIEKGCTDASATNYDSNANQDNGSCEYPVAEQPEKTSSSSSGTFGYLLAMCLLVAFRRLKA